MPYESYIDYYLAVARGIKDVTITTVQGYCTTMSATAGLVLSPINLYAMTTPAMVTASAQYMRLSSSDANDATAGTGAVQVYVEGVDEDGESQEEAVLISGQTPKTTASKYVAVNRMYCHTCGSGGINAGTIYITGNADSTAAGVPKSTSGVYSILYAGNGASMDARYVVPASCTGYIARIRSGQNHTTDNTTIKAFIKEENKPKKVIAYAVGDKSFEFTLPIKLPAKTYFWCEGTADASATSANIIAEMVLVKGSN